MSQATERMIEWFAAQAGRVTYSMFYRNGPGSYDCSSAIYFAMIHAGLRPPGSWIGNTESLFRDLPGTGWYQLSSDPVTGFIDARRGDVFIWGRQGASTGAAGHTGIFVDPENIIHCNYGSNGITIDAHDYIHALNGYPPNAVYRHTGPAPSTPTTSKNDQEIQLMSKEYDDIMRELRSIKTDTSITRGGIFGKFSYTGKPGTEERGVIDLLKAIDRATWNTKKMTRYLFNMFRIGTPGVMTDGRLGGKVRRLLAYNEAEDGPARRAEWERDGKRQYDF